MNLRSMLRQALVVCAASGCLVMAPMAQAEDNERIRQILVELGGRGGRLN